MGGYPDPPAPPQEKSQYTYQDGDLVSSRVVNPDGTITTKQISSAEEQANKKRRTTDLASIEQQMKDYLPNLNSIDPQLQKQIDAQAAANTDAAQKQLNEAFQNVMKTIADNSTARYGSTQNAYYDRQVSDANKQLAQQQSQLAQDILAQKSNLINNQLAQNQNYYNALQNQATNLREGINDFRDQQAQNYGITANSTQMSNDFNTSKYATEMQGYNAQMQAAIQRNNSFMGLLSDKRLKENITPITNVLDKLDSLGVYNYNYLSQVDFHDGVMAQELEKEFPELVNTSPNDGFKRVDYAGLTAILLQAVKELKQQIKGES